LAEFSAVGMKQTRDVINQMGADGIIGRYAIAGAVAAYNYIEPALTNDLDILVSLDTPAAEGKINLISLDPVYSYLGKKGYNEHREEGIVIEGWPVQFLPVASQLDLEALAQAEDVDIEINEVEGSFRTRILRPEHTVASAVRGGRPQAFVRISQFLQERAVDLMTLCPLVDRHNLKREWQSFCKRAGIGDPCQAR